MRKGRYSHWVLLLGSAQALTFLMWVHYDQPERAPAPQACFAVQ